MAPVLLRNHFHSLARPVDGGRHFRGQPLFGDHKTWRGLIVATIAGGLMFEFERYLSLHVDVFSNFSPFAMNLFPLWFGFAFAAGAILGDLIKSFFKRRVHIASGATWFPFDQIDFLLGASIVASVYVRFTAVMWLMIIAVGPIFHISVNRIAFWMKLKDTPW